MRPQVSIKEAAQSIGERIHYADHTSSFQSSIERDESIILNQNCVPFGDRNA